MDLRYLKNDIEVICVKASSFPQGVLAAHKELESKIKSTTGRRLFGISFPQQGEIVYSAAATQSSSDEAKHLGCDKFTIKSGLHVGQEVLNWQEKAHDLQNVFERLISDPRTDPNGYCLEEYVSDNDLICMVPLNAELVLEQDRKELTAAIEKVFSELIALVNQFTELQFNTVPFEGSWTPGQVVDHISKATGAIPDAHTKQPDRVYNALADAVDALFLNFNIKMESPDFIKPEQGPFQIAKSVSDLERIKKRHLHAINQSDLHEICLDFELPNSGLMTRYEWYRFVICHSQRHLHQLRNIHSKIK
jgi:hypothetical protein